MLLVSRECVGVGDVAMSAALADAAVRAGGEQPDGVNAEPADHDARMEVVGCRILPSELAVAQVVRIVNPDSREPLPPGVVGEIWVAGASVARGYWELPEVSAETMRATLDLDALAHLDEPSAAARLDPGAAGACAPYAAPARARTAALNDSPMVAPSAGCAQGSALASRGAAGPHMRTGDLGFVWGGRLYIVGRIKDVLTMRGRSLHASDIETCDARSRLHDAPPRDSTRSQQRTLICDPPSANPRMRAAIHDARSLKPRFGSSRPTGDALSMSGPPDGLLARRGWLATAAVWVRRCLRAQRVGRDGRGAPRPRRRAPAGDSRRRRPAARTLPRHRRRGARARPCPPLRLPAPARLCACPRDAGAWCSGGRHRAAMNPCQHAGAWCSGGRHRAAKNPCREASIRSAGM